MELRQSLGGSLDYIADRETACVGCIPELILEMPCDRADKTERSAPGVLIFCDIPFQKSRHFLEDEGI